MIDNLLGRPSRRIKRYQTLCVLLFWAAVLVCGPRHGPRVRPVRWLGRRLRLASPWQVVIGVLVSLYGLKNIDSVLGLAPPEPLARLYNRNFYRATWINCALDTAFTTSMPIRPKWLRDICSILFTFYFLVFDRAADERLRKYRVYSTIDMLRTQWHKTSNPYIRFVTSLTWYRPKLVKKLLLPRPPIGAYARRPIQAMLFFDGSYAELRDQHQLILDFPGGGWISMSPEHHEERLRQLAKETGKVVLSLNYVKAPEFVFPVAQEECFDAYRILQLSRGRVIGMSGSDDFQIIVTGDSAGGHMAASCMIRIIEYPDHHVRAAYQAKRTSLEEEQCRMLGLSMEDEPPPLPQAVGLLLAYPSVNFNYGLWLDHETLRVLRKQSERSLHEMGTPSDAVKVVDLGGPERSTRTRSRSNSRSRVSRKYSQAELRHMRRASGSFPDVSTLAAASQTPAAPTSPSQSTKPQRPEMARTKSLSHFSSLAGEARKHLAERAEFARAADTDESEEGLSQSVDTAQESGVEAPRIGQPLFDDPTVSGLPGLLVGSPMLDESVESTGSASLSRSASLAALLRKDEHLQEALARTKADEDARLEKQQASKSGPIETRLTMSSTASYFNDRILTPGMMRAMGILYIGPHRQPDLKTNYYLQPVIAPSSILAQFPPTLIVVGEKDPLCDDSVVLAGRIWEAKMARRAGTERKRAQQEQARTQLGEKLRMSFPAADHEQEEEWDEPEEEFVHLRVLEGWSHGFMQMSSIMPEAIKVIRFLGLWMDDTFDLFEERQAGREQAAAAAQSHFTLPRAKGPTSVSATPDHLSPMASPLAYPTPPLARSPRPRLAVSSAENNGASSEPEDGGLVFTPKRTTPLSGVNSPRLNGVGDDTKPGSFPCSGSVSPAHTAALRNEGGATSAFSSTGSLTPGTEALVAPSTAHGSSKRSAARKAADTETKDLLVAQQSLFQRRREAVTFGLEAASPLSNSADEDVRGEPSRRNSRK